MSALCYDNGMGKYEHVKDARIFQNIFIDLENGALTTPVQTQNYTVIQVADSYYLSNFEIKNHRQYCDLEVTFVTFGNLVCTTDGSAEKLKKDDAYLSFAGERHGLFSRSRARFLTLAVNVKPDSPAGAILQKLKNGFSFPESRKCTLPHLMQPLSSIIAEFLAPDRLFSELMIDASITAALTEVARGDAPRAGKSYASSEKMLSDVIGYLDSDYLSIKTLQEVSEQLGYSHGYLCKLFRQTYGVTMQEYLLQRKMHHAATLVRQGRPVSQIAEELGYQNGGNFSRAFKKYFGTSPKYF